MSMGPSVNLQTARTRAMELYVNNWKYIYGFKYRNNPVQRATIDMLAKMYPATFSSNYKKKAYALEGMNAIDCSGLVCYAIGIDDISSTHILERAEGSNYYEVHDYDEHIALVNTPGMILWKRGHVGFYMGDYVVIEARSMEYGVTTSKLTDSWRGWEKLIIPEYVPSGDYENVGWNKDSCGWWYAYGHNKGEYYKSQIATINGKTYAFNEDGYCVWNPAIEYDNSGAIVSVTGGNPV